MSHELYPWQQTESDPEALREGLRQSVASKAGQGQSVREAFFAENTDALIDSAQALAGGFAAGGRLYTMGNGGSACDAMHIAVEFNHPITTGRPALPSVCLCTDTALLTAIGNDVGIEHVFVRALSCQARAGDMLIGVSTSGNSANLLRAFETARDRGMLTIALIGGDGGALAGSEAVDHVLTVATDSVHRVQETHVVIYHILWDLVHSLLAAR